MLRASLFGLAIIVVALAVATRGRADGTPMDEVLYGLVTFLPGHSGTAEIELGADGRICGPFTMRQTEDGRAPVEMFNIPAGQCIDKDHLR